LPAQQPGTSIWLKKSTQRRKGARAQRINGVCLAVLAALRLCVKSGHEAVKGAVPIVIYSKQKSFCNSGSIFKIATRFETIRSDPFTSRLTKKAEPPPTRDGNRDSGTDSANGGWLRRLVRRSFYGHNAGGFVTTVPSK
jgi:hypothetical protein